MEKTVMKVEIELLEDQLGTVPKNRDVYTKYIATKVIPEVAAEEAQNIVEDDTSGWTTFMEDEDGLFIYNYMILGFLRDAGNNLKDQLKIKNLKSKLENFIFVTPRKIRFVRNGVNIMKCDSVFERPLRAMTAQGPRVTLAKSDVVHAGAKLSFDITLVNHKEITSDTIKEILNFGELKGLGQFRNGSFGQFKVNSFTVIESISQTVLATAK